MFHLFFLDYNISFPSLFLLFLSNFGQTQKTPSFPTPFSLFSLHSSHHISYLVHPMSANVRYPLEFRARQEPDSKNHASPQPGHKRDRVCNHSSMPFPARFGMFQSMTNLSGSEADTLSYICKSYPEPLLPLPHEDRSQEKATLGPHVLPPDGSHCWRRRCFPPFSLAVNLFWKLWLQLASVASAILLVISGEPRKNDSCFFNEFSYHQMSPGICSQLWTGRGCAQQLHHSQFLSLF